MERSNFKFEVCANSVESCLAAQEGGADRVELCAGIPEGGITPSYGEILQARRFLKKTRLHVIIRPRGGDFLYNDLEVERMATDIRIAYELGADGVVFGCLTKDGNIDVEKNSFLLKEASGISVTFHRAFDCCRNPKKALVQLSDLGFNRILTSGQQPTAPQGVKLLSELNKVASNGIIIMAGCGVNENNISQLYNDTSITEFHFSAREIVKRDMIFSNPNVYMGREGADEFSLAYTTMRRVKATINALICK